MNENEDKVDRIYRAAVAGLEHVLLNDMPSWYSYIASLPTVQQMVYAVSTLDQQVINGGFHQYFLNSYGQFCYLARAGLLRINAQKSALTIDRAINAVNHEHLPEQDFIVKVAKGELSRINEFDDELFDVLNKLDNEYYDSGEDLKALLNNYLGGEI
jgi:hypothetical protein